MRIEMIFWVMTFGAPALIILGGLTLSVLGYSLYDAGMSNWGYGLIFLGAAIYVLEIILTAKSKR
jgi:hypothetical protein